MSALAMTAALLAAFVTGLLAYCIWWIAVDLREEAAQRRKDAERAEEAQRIVRAHQHDRHHHDDRYLRSDDRSPE